MASSNTATTDPLDLFLSSLAERLGGLQGDDLHAFEDLEFYSRYVIGYNNPDFQNNSPFIRRIYETLQFEDEQNILILGPRGSAKSTAVDVVYLTWKIGKNPLVRFLLAVASQQAQGEAFARQISYILENNERYKRIFGNLFPNKRNTTWSRTEKIVVRPEPPGGMKDPTLSVVGLESNVPSKRADEIIIDDLVTQENAYSAIQRAKVSRFVFQVLFPIGVPGCRRIIVGSRWDERDLYGEIADKWGLELPQVEPISLSDYVVVE